jgi:hypothetical protein
MSLDSVDTPQDEGVMISRSTLRAIANTLETAVHVQVSMRRLASNMFDAPEMHEAFLHIVREMTRSSVMRMEACMKEIPGAPCLGYFDGELDPED